MKYKAHLNISALSDVGRVRENNEDNLLINNLFIEPVKIGNFNCSFEYDTESIICAVCDGMGGEKSGEIASLEAVRSLSYTVRQPRFSFLKLKDKIEKINTFIGNTNSRIYDMANNSLDMKGMGTTFACLVISGGQAVAMNVGDSRVYMLRKGELIQLTRDHTENERLIREGVLSREQAKNHKSRYILNRHLGMPPEYGELEAESSEIIDIRKNDIFMICSDGLTDMADDIDIKNILASDLSPYKSCSELIDKALSNGGKDNVTVIVVEITKTTLAIKTQNMINKLIKTRRKSKI